MSRTLRTAVVLHIDERGDYSLKVWDPTGEVLVLWIDENARTDRVYEWTSREGDIADLKALIGDSAIGHRDDGTIDAQTEQAIRAMHWRMTGGELEAVEQNGGAQ